MKSWPVPKGAGNLAVGRQAYIAECDCKSLCLPTTLGKSCWGEPENVAPAALGEESLNHCLPNRAFGWPTTAILIAIAIAMIVAVLAVVHMTIAGGIDRSVPIILNEVDLSLTCIVAAAIGPPVLALIGRNPQVDWLIIFRTQRSNEYRAGIV